MNLLIEVQIKDSLPVNGTWQVPSLSAVDLMPVLHLLGQDGVVEWTEEDIFRASRDDEGKIMLEFPMDTKHLDLLVFCIKRVIDGMISAVLDTAWANEIYMRIEKARKGGLIVPQAQAGGPLRL